MSHTPGKFVVMGESSEYWNVYESVNPPEWAAELMEPGEEANRPVCRVHKHSEGRANLAKILALPDLLEALRALQDIWQTSIQAHNPDEDRYEPAFRNAQAAIAKAEGQHSS